jgi:hypothetical protein
LWKENEGEEMNYDLAVSGLTSGRKKEDQFSLMPQKAGLESYSDMKAPEVKSRPQISEQGAGLAASGMMKVYSDYQRGIEEREKQRISDARQNQVNRVQLLQNMAQIYRGLA